jgi:predicted AlkP superfamily phosphohydrolase/phosphomutase
MITETRGLLRPTVEATELDAIPVMRGSVAFPPEIQIPLVCLLAAVHKMDRSRPSEKPIDMAKRRLLVIGLDGFDISLAERLLDEGTLPNLARLRLRSARYDLDHGFDKYSGLAWEHVVSGLSPGDGARWSAITFDPATYAARQEVTSARPFLADLSARTVVFDVPYCDLERAPLVRGVTCWGAHDPGVRPASRPQGIHAELNRIFGPYPATSWIYGFCWPSADKAQAAGTALVRAVETRTRAARWLLSERLPDWDLAIMVVSEAHSVIEPLWHGVDSAHPLHGVKSTAAANEAVHNVYAAIDDLIGQLENALADTTIIVFAMHGMGANESDIPSMVLLPELLYRVAFGSSYMLPSGYAGATASGVPLLAEDETWEDVMLRVVPKVQPARSHAPFAGAFEWLARAVRFAGRSPAAPDPTGIAWMPAARYGPFWPQMPAFALPAYYDGRIRINLAGREKQGVVPADEYERTCRQTIDLLRGCRNLLTGEEVVENIHWPKKSAGAVGPSEADLYVIWKSAAVGLSTPGFGDIGPVPYRRTGGHTGARGFLYMSGEGITPTSTGVLSSFDVVPTIIDLLGEAKPAAISGRSIAGIADVVARAG